MNPRNAAVAAAMLLTLTGCSTTASSIVIGSAGPAWEGPVFISQTAMPEGIEYKVIGTVQADAQVGYDAVVTLYPLLAAEARKIGANAVVNAKGGRRLTAFSWAAAYVIGTAVKVDDPQKLKGLPGTYH
jgi:hypothetical protein